MLQTGQILNNRYRIVRLLGQGGFGAVYRVWDLNLESPRALKENLDTSPVAQRQFKREAQTLDKLSHPNLPKVIDHFILPGQGQYLVMEFVEGDDLQEILDQQKDSIPENLALRWIEQICDALSYLHSQTPPIIHRDIKPANIKITPTGKAVLVDFGIAKVFDPKLRTTIGAQAVTPGFSPPEQYGRGVTDPRTDIYSLGATLYSLLTGLTPPESVNMITNQQLRPEGITRVNPRTSREVESAITRAMSLSPDLRFTTAEEFKQALRKDHPKTYKVPVSQPSVTQVADFHPFITQETQPPTSIYPTKNLKIWLPWIVVLFVVMIAAVLIIRNGSGGESNPTEEAMVAGVTSIVREMTSTLSEKVSPLTPLPSESPIPTSTSAATVTPMPSKPVLPSQTNTASAFPTASITLSPMPTEISIVTKISPMDGVVMIYIPAGEFQMGSSSDIVDAFDNEFPQHSVYLDAFWIDQTEVTNAMFAAFLNAQGTTSDGGNSWLDTESVYLLLQKRNGNWEPKPEYIHHPVIEVTWYGAQAYCQWAERRLPTEAEWEKAARTDQNFIYPWGNEFDCSRGNFDDETAQHDEYMVPGGQGCDGFNRTAPVGSFQRGSNPFGIMDMAGNVWEWVSDWYLSNYYYSFPLNSWPSNPMGPLTGESRVLQGGAWDSDVTSFLRAANRYDRPPDYASPMIGFRCADSP